LGARFYALQNRAFSALDFSANFSKPPKIKKKFRLENMQTILREIDEEKSLSPPQTGVRPSKGRSLKLSRSMPG